MQQPKKHKKLRLNLETLKHVVAGAPDRLLKGSSGNGCTVDTTCSPGDCCPDGVDG